MQRPRRQAVARLAPDAALALGFGGCLGKGGQGSGLGKGVGYRGLRRGWLGEIVGLALGLGWSAGRKGKGAGEGCLKVGREAEVLGFGRRFELRRVEGRSTPSWIPPGGEEAGSQDRARALAQAAPRRFT